MNYRERLGHITFPNRADAERTLDILLDILDEYGEVFISDYFDLAGAMTDAPDHHYGWLNLDQARVFCNPPKNYYISFPDPILLRDMDLQGYVNRGYSTNQIRKENENMNKINYNIGSVPNCYRPMTSLDYEIEALRDEYKKKIDKLEAERERKIDELRKKYDREEYVELCKRDAFRAKAKLDALVEAGFTDDEAKAMIMTELKNY